MCLSQLLVPSIFYHYKTAENLSHYSPKGFNFLIFFPCLTFVYLHSRNKQMKIAKPFRLIGDAIEKSQIINNGWYDMLGRIHPSVICLIVDIKYNGSAMEIFWVRWWFNFVNTYVLIKK